MRSLPSLQNLRRGGSVLGIRAVAIISQAASFVIVARSTSLSVTGAFALANGSWVLGRALLPLGWDTALLREFSLFFKTGAQSMPLRRGLTSATLMLLGIYLASSGVAAALLWNLPKILVPVLIAIAVGACWASVGVGISVMRARGYLVTGQLVDGGLLQTVPCVALVLLLIVDEVDLPMIFLAYCLGAIAASIVALGLAFRISRPAAVVGSLGSMWRLALRLWQTQLLSALISRAAVFIAAPVVGLAESAVVEAGLRTQLVSVTLAWSSGIIMSPRYAASSRRESSRVLMRVILATAVPSLIACAILVAAGPPVLSFLGPGYYSARLAIYLMALAGVVEVPAACAGYYFVMSGLERSSALALLGQFLVLATGAVVLGRLFGAQGIAVAVLAGAGTRTVGSLMLLWRAGALRFEARPRVGV